MKIAILLLIETRERRDLTKSFPLFLVWSTKRVELNFSAMELDSTLSSSFENIEFVDFSEEETVMREETENLEELQCSNRSNDDNDEWKEAVFYVHANRINPYGFADRKWEQRFVFSFSAVEKAKLILFRNEMSTMIDFPIRST